MKVLMVWPNKDEFGWKPIGLSLITSILKAEGHEVALFDTTYIDFGVEDNTTRTEKACMHKKVSLGGLDIGKQNLDLRDEFTKKLNDFRPDVVGISALSDEIDIGLKISRFAKEWNSNTVVLWGNKLATMDTVKILKHDSVDYVCVGEGIKFIREFMECLENNRDVRGLNNLAFKDDTNTVRVNPLSNYYQGLDDLPFLDWSLFDKRHFVKPFDGKLHTGGDHMIFWGCPNQCSYCINASYRKLYGQKAGKFLRNYSVKRIIEELKHLVSTWGVSLFKFHDEDYCLKKEAYFAELSELYASEINVPFVIMANAKNITPAKVKMLKHMNCVSVSLGIETANTNLRHEILKRHESKEDIIKAVGLLNDAGIRTSSFNMLGIPFETKETIFETIELNREAKVRYPAAQFFFPLEGTELRRISIENGFFDADSHAVFRRDRPSLNFSNISHEELMSLMERFTLYIKLPLEFRKYIDRSCVEDASGKALTTALYDIYSRHVFSNNGFWDESCDTNLILKKLDSI